MKTNTPSPIIDSRDPIGIVCLLRGLLLSGIDFMLTPDSDVLIGV